MNPYPAGVSGAEIDGDDLSLDEIIDNADRKELTRMIFEFMGIKHGRELLLEFVNDMAPGQVDSMIEDLLYEERNIKIAREFIKDNCPNIAE